MTAPENKSDAEGVMRTSRVFAVPPQAIFAAIQAPQRLARWWGPAGFSNRFHVFDFRPGGVWAFDMLGPDGHVYANLAEFLVIEAARRVVLRHSCPPFFQLSIQLTALADGTLLEWEQAFDDPAVAAALRAIVEPCNEQNLDRLAVELGRAEN